MYVINFKKQFYDIINNSENRKANDLQKTIRKTVQQIKKTNYVSFKKMHNQLKPLHGHPNNKKQLHEINAKMLDALENLKNEFHDNILALKVLYIFRHFPKYK